MITAHNLADYLGSPSLPDQDAGPVIDAATQLVNQTLGGNLDDVPASILSQAEVIVAAELWRRRDAPGGVVNAWGDAATPVRLARDPITPALPLLRPWMAPVIA
ncbi:MAG: hypothetical protein E6261_04610 [Cutibacterium avidum]|nr:hypothetical protein [Cutibacterium avidum]